MYLNKWLKQAISKLQKQFIYSKNIAVYKKNKLAVQVNIKQEITTAKLSYMIAIKKNPVTGILLPQFFLQYRE